MNRRTLLQSFVFALALTATAACQKRDMEAPISRAAEAQNGPAAGGELEADESSAQTKSEPLQVPQKRMIIKTADVTLESDEPVKTAEKARALVESASGFVVSSETTRWLENDKQVRLTLRVPSEKFDSTLDAIAELGDPVAESVSGKDVTEEYVDVQAKLRNQKKLEARFHELLTQAETVADTLEIEKELARVRTEIDRLEGRRKYLADQVALSTINLTVQPTPSLGGGRGLGHEISEALSDSGEIITVVIGGIIRFAAGLLPIAVLLGIAVLILRAILKRRKQKRRRDDKPGDQTGNST